MIDKSIRADYEMQGKVKNYLGKQKMVKAPKKWKSAPNHPETELAYITKAEKDALIKMNMYGSMNGKANKGPSGIISLNGWGDRGDTSDRSYGGGNVSGGGDNRDYGGGAAAEARSAGAAATQEAARVAAVNAARDEAAAKAKRDMQATIAQAEKAQEIKEKMQMATRGYMKPITFPKRQPTVYKTSGTGPFNRERDDSDYQDRIRQAKSKIEFDPNLSNKEKVERNKILEDFEYKGTFAPQEDTRGIMSKIFGDNPFEWAANIGSLGGYQKAKYAKAIMDLKNRKGVAGTALKFLEDTTGKNVGDFIRTDTINNRTNNISNVQDTRDGIRSNIISGGGDVVSQKVKEFTGEPTVEKVTEQPSDSQRSQLLKLLQQLQQYDSQNRLNEKGKQTLAQLMSFMNQPITGRSRDI